MIMVKINQEVKNQIHEEYITTFSGIRTRINCVEDCDFDWMVTLEELQCYNSDYLTNFKYENKDWCPPCVDEETGNQIICN